MILNLNDPFLISGQHESGINVSITLIIITYSRLLFFINKVELIVINQIEQGCNNNFGIP